MNGVTSDFHCKMFAVQSAKYFQNNELSSIEYIYIYIYNLILSPSFIATEITYISY